MNAAVGLMDGLGLDGDRCIRVIPRQICEGITYTNPIDINDNDLQNLHVRSTGGLAEGMERRKSISIYKNKHVPFSM